MAKGPRMVDVNSMIAAGVNPKTGLPLRMADTAELKTNLKKLLRIVDEQDAVNRFVWYNLPEGLNGQLLERILYYKGQGAFFYIEETKKFYFLPYALDGEIDIYGRFKGIRPLPFNGSNQDSAKGQTALKLWLNNQVKTPYYDLVLPEDLELETMLDGCVILKDYSEQVSQTNIPRQLLNDPLLDVMGDCIPFMRTALLNSTGVQGMRVGDESEQSNVKAASSSVNQAALEGEKWVPIVGTVDFQDLTASNVGKAEDFMSAMQSLDNFRLGLYGLTNGGLWAKKAHMLQTEEDMNTGTTGLVMQDCLANRQRFCNIVNSIWGLGIWCEVSETETGDKDLDGDTQDDIDQSGEAKDVPEGGADDE